MSVQLLKNVNASQKNAHKKCSRVSKKGLRHFKKMYLQYKNVCIVQKIISYTSKKCMWHLGKCSCVSKNMIMTI